MGSERSSEGQAPHITVVQPFCAYVYSIEDVQLTLRGAGEGAGDLQFFQKLLQEFKSTRPTGQSLQPLFKVKLASNLAS